jgi:hypothetical protein
LAFDQAYNPLMQRFVIVLLLLLLFISIFMVASSNS